MHLGHNRSVADIVRAAIQEDADGIAVSSYQGGHNEYFRYMVDMLKEQGASTSAWSSAAAARSRRTRSQTLEAYGVEKIYTPEDGRRLGLDGMIEDVFARVRAARASRATSSGRCTSRDHRRIARAISAARRRGRRRQRRRSDLRRALGDASKHAARRSSASPARAAPASLSLTDELLQRFVRHFPDRHIAVVAMDPTRRRSGGALLGDRIRMNSLANEQIFMRSLATRRQHLATTAVLDGRDRAVPARGLRPDRRRDRRHRAVATPRSSTSSTCRCTS